MTHENYPELESFAKASEKHGELRALYLINLETMQMRRKILHSDHQGDKVVTLLNQAASLLKKEGLDLFLFDAEERILAERLHRGMLLILSAEKSTNYGNLLTLMKRIRKEALEEKDDRR